MLERAHGNVVVDPVEEEVEHEEERAIGKPLFDVENETVHDVFEDLHRE